MDIKQTRYQAHERHLSRIQHRLAEIRQRSNQYAWFRAAIFFGGLAVSGALFFVAGPTVGSIALILTIAAFLVAIAYHARVDSFRSRLNLLRQHTSAQMARMTLDWGRIPALTRFTPSHQHPFEADLDLLGQHSLHWLLDTAISREGSELLKQWLTTPLPQRREIERRQQLVRELVPRHLFRAKLVVNASHSTGSQKVWTAQELLQWLTYPGPGPSLRTWFLVFAIFAGVNFVLIGLTVLGLLPGFLWQTTVTLFLIAQFAFARLTGPLFGPATRLQGTFEQLSAVFMQLETFSYRQTPHLKELCKPFWEGERSEHKPSRYLPRLTRLMSGVSARSNPFTWIFLNALLPWDLFFATRLDKYRREVAAHAPDWLETWAEVEALSSLANYAYLNPQTSFPTVWDDDSRQPVLETVQLGHPLLPEAQRVCNDFSISQLGELTIITGSNMAGKSTFLRTLGVNLALAFAGGPVVADKLETRLFRLFTAIKVSDSVTDGISYFYAEVKRLKALLVALEDAHELPLFCFIDEIFRGTNNRERLIGSRAYLKALVGKRGVGLVSTHDLELVKLADELPHVKNYHFRDDVVAERMDFDYILRPGPCPTTNALKIMRLEGLPVGDRGQ